MRFRRRRFCFRKCIKREFSKSTIILNNATIFESILMKIIMQKHVHEFDVNNDDDFQCLNSFIDVNFVYNCETKINYFWYITFALILKKNVVIAKQFWSIYRCKTHLIEHFWYKTHLIDFDIKRIWKLIRKYCKSNQ